MRSHLLQATFRVHCLWRGTHNMRCARLGAGAYTFQITITKQYNSTTLFEDLKALYRIAGVKGQHVAFIFTCA